MKWLTFAGLSSWVVSTSDCGVRGTMFESHRWQLCSSRQLLRYTVLSTGCAPLLQCLGRLSLPPFVGRQNEYQPTGWVIITLAIVDVDDSCQFWADSQPKSTGLVWGLVATQRSIYIHQMNRVNSRNDFGHDDSTINIVMAIIIIICINAKAKLFTCTNFSYFFTFLVRNDLHTNLSIFFHHTLTVFVTLLQKSSNMRIISNVT